MVNLWHAAPSLIAHEVLPQFSTGYVRCAGGARACTGDHAGGSHAHVQGWGACTEGTHALHFWVPVFSFAPINSIVGQNVRNIYCLGLLMES